MASLLSRIVEQVASVEGVDFQPLKAEGFILGSKNLCVNQLISNAHLVSRGTFSPLSLCACVCAPFRHCMKTAKSIFYG